ncbi:LysM peptidoglycan-binding domain-containing protein [Virgibacillus necropolis]|uniref:LysM peptidoglycan-binding and 3D domain-containing protein n=1 Tax=Virgibacillus necropolis TaxID=163877 RepID=UPI003850B3BC
MKKLVSLFVGLFFIGISAISVSAAEYEVQKGDTLWNIAINHNTNVEELMDINGLDSSLIYPKQVLKINESKIEHYMVQKGDTLSQISKDYGDGVTVANLKAWNDLPTDLIITGQQLIVNGPETTQQEATKQVKQKTNTDAHVSKSESVEVKASRDVSKLEEKKESKKQQTKVEGRTLSVEATAYTAYCTGCSGITATGVNLRENANAKVIAVDPSVIPLGTKVYVEGYGYAVAADTGGAINGNKIDVHFPTKDQAYNWGRRIVDVTIIN